MGLKYFLIVLCTICLSLYSEVIIAGSCPTITLQPVNDTICTGDTTYFNLIETGGTGVGFQWLVNMGAGYLPVSDGSNYNGSSTDSLAVLNAGLVFSSYSYQCVVTSSGCPNDTSAPAVLIVNTLPSIKALASENNLCYGTKIALTGSGGKFYNWSSGIINAIAFLPDSSKMYYVTGTDINGCQAKDSIFVVVHPLPIIKAYSKDSSICKGDSILFYAQGAKTYSWSGGIKDSVYFSPTTTNTYTVTGTDSNGCSATAQLKLKVGPKQLDSLSGTSIICFGDSALVMVTVDSAGYKFLWNTGDTSNTIHTKPSATQTYNVKINNGFCIKDTSATVTVNHIPVPTISTNQSICLYDTATLTAGGGQLYAWSPATGLSSVDSSTTLANPTSPQTYTVVVTNIACPTATASVQVVVNPLPTGSICCSTTILLHESAPLQTITASQGATFAWSPVDGLSCTTCQNTSASPETSTTYSVKITDANGCTTIDTAVVKVNPICNLFVPTAFSPNQDGVNDVIGVMGDCIQTMQFSIFDKWGERVFYASDPAKTWDGTYNGEAMNPGVYVYYLTATSFGGQNFTRKGDITLVR